MTTHGSTAGQILSSGPRSRASIPWSPVLILALIFTALAGARFYSYLLFHTLAEFYSILIATTYFVIAWHTRGINENPSIVALGLAYLFVAFLDTFHTLSYAGMGVFSGYDFPANQVWVVARFLEATSLLCFSFMELRTPGKLLVFIGGYSLVTVGGLAAIFVFHVFPACYIAGSGQTPFKVGMELLIIGILAAAFFVLALRRDRYPRSVVLTLQSSIALTILAELSFTLYLSNYDWVNMVGHFLKIASFYLVYRSIIVTGLERPQELFYAKLRSREEELRRANEAKDSFISILTHDLRSPLSGMLGLVQGLSRGTGDVEPELLEESLNELAKTAEKSLDLVEHVLSWARSQSGGLKPQIAVVELSSLLAEQGALSTDIARTKGISLELALPQAVYVSADPEMLASILRNLVQNALKFTRPGGRVWAEAGRREDRWTIEINDDGVGMSPEELGKLFRIDGRLRGVGTAGERGTGFGLILSAEFARLMGGKLEATSVQDKGSHFRLTLKAAADRESYPSHAQIS